jgi:hypothetical protein
MRASAHNDGGVAVRVTLSCALALLSPAQLISSQIVMMAALWRDVLWIAMIEPSFKSRSVPKCVK